MEQSTGLSYAYGFSVTSGDSCTGKHKYVIQDFHVAVQNCFFETSLTHKEVLYVASCRAHFPPIKYTQYCFVVELLSVFPKITF